MDDGRLTGATGKQVDFTNVTLIMTSNLGAQKQKQVRLDLVKQHTKIQTYQAVKTFHLLQSLEIELMLL